uniref:Integral membrane protein n=1 Tax=Streptomyces sp. NBC_01393 TaxID=2903851 RepID=A0AAU3HQH1_9ACTN
MAVRTTDRWIAARIRQEWWHAAAWVLLGLALSAVAVGPSLYVPGKVATEAAFRDARPCAGEAPARDDGAGCLRTIRGTVLSARTVKSGRTKVFRVRLRPPGPAPADQSIDLDAHGDLSELVQPGEGVDVTTWRNDVVSVSQGGVRERLAGLPDEDPTVFTGAALVVVWSAVLAFIAAFGSARRARCLATGRPVVPRVPFGRAKPVGVVAVPLVAAFCAGHFWDTWTAVVMAVVLCALIAVPATILALRWDREPSPASPPGKEVTGPLGEPV